MIQELLNHLWQSTLFVGAAALMALLLKSNRAQTRYWVWFAASTKFLIPFSLLVGLGTHLPHHVAVPPIRTGWVAAFQEFSQTLVLPGVREPAAVSVRPLSDIDGITAGSVVWVCGFVAVVILWFRQWRGIHALRSSARAVSIPTTLPSPVPIMAAPDLVEPGVIGILRPVLLLPEGIRDQLNQTQLDALLTHEFCHVRRRDNLTAAIHMVVQAIFWFHPLTWWIGARLLAERERACDEEVLRGGCKANVYAESILVICRLYLSSPLACISGVAGSNLKERIDAILRNQSVVGLNLGKKVVLTGACMAALVVPVMIGALSAPAFRAQETPDWQAKAGGKMEFEVASVRLNPGPPEPANFRLSPDDAYGNTGGLLIADYNLASYIDFAYKVGPSTREQFYAMYGHLPNWVRTDNYEIRARAETTNPTKDQMRLMMQSLLIERFGLVVHYEEQDTPVLEMTLKKPATLGPQLRRHEDGPACNIKGTWEPGRELKKTDIFPSQCDELFEVMPGPDHTLVMGARDATMESIANSFGPGRLGRPVEDATGLTGKYDFTVQWTPNAGDFGYASNSAPPGVPRSDAQGTPFLDAVKEQLGLKLKPGKAMLKVLVIDHVARPSEN
jgi:bla regulator protein blaR1